MFLQNLQTKTREANKLFLLVKLETVNIIFSFLLHFVFVFVFYFDSLQIFCGPVGSYVGSLFRFRFADVWKLWIGQMLKTVQSRSAFSGHSVSKDISRDFVVLLNFRLNQFWGSIFSAETSEIWKTSEWWNVLVAELEMLSESVLTGRWDPV